MRTQLVSENLHLMGLEKNDTILLFGTHDPEPTLEQQIINQGVSRIPHTNGFTLGPKFSVNLPDNTQVLVMYSLSYEFYVPNDSMQNGHGSGDPICHPNSCIVHLSVTNSLNNFQTNIFSEKAGAQLAVPSDDGSWWQYKNIFMGGGIRIPGPCTVKLWALNENMHTAQLYISALCTIETYSG